MPSILFDSTINFLEIALDVRVHRHLEISSNLANLDTPGYKPKITPFEEQFRRVLDSEAIGKNSFAVTHEKHIPISTNMISNLARNSLAISPDEEMDHSNTASLEKGMTELAENALMYNALAHILKRRFDQLRFVIREGR
jgi:flagellar basal-body rod protein FlgB